MQQMHCPSPLEILAPLFAMAAPDQLSSGEVGAVIQDQYMRVLENFHPVIAQEGVLAACRGRAFRPSPSAVDEVTAAVLYKHAGRALEASTKLVDWAPGEIEAWSKLAPRERLDAGRQQWARHFGIPWESYQRCEGDLEKARLLPGWDSMEPNRSQPSQLQMLAESMLTKMPAVRNGQEGRA